jgi:hypothetical protein
MTLKRDVIWLLGAAEEHLALHGIDRRVRGYGWRALFEGNGSMEDKS